MSKGKFTGINWILTPDKFLSLEEAKKLLETARERAEMAKSRGHKIPVRDYFIIDLALSTGLRVMEIAQLSCGDVFIQDAVCSLFVRKGKGGKQRLVRFNGSFKKHYKEYIFWKQTIGEPTGPVDPLMLSSNTGSYEHAGHREGLLANRSQIGPVFTLFYSLPDTYVCMSAL